MDSSTDLRGSPVEESGPDYEETSEPVPEANPYPPDGFYCDIGDTRIEYYPVLMPPLRYGDENVFYFK